MPLALIAALLFVVVVWLALSRRAIGIGGLLLGAAALLLTILAGAGGAIALWRLVLAWHPDFRQMLQGDPYHAWIYRAAFTALSIGIFAAIYQLLRRRVAMLSLWAGALLLWLVIAVAGTVELPGASYVFLWPLLFALAGFGILIARGGELDSWGTAAIVWACAVPGIVMIGPLIDQLFVAMTMTVAAAPALFTVLLLGLAIPLVEIVCAPRHWWLPGAAVAVCAAFLIGGATLAGFDADHPKPTSLFYGLDADSGQGAWFSGDVHPDAWTAPVMGTHPQRVAASPFMPFLKWPMWENAGVSAALAVPVMDRIDDSTEGDVRTLRLRIASPRHAEIVYVYGDPRAQVLAAEVNGKSVGPDIRARDYKLGLSMLNVIRFEQWSFEYFGPPTDGFDLHLRVKAPAGPLHMLIIDQSYGLTGSGAPDRPPHTMPFPWVTDSVFVRKSYDF